MFSREHTWKGQNRQQETKNKKKHTHIQTFRTFENRGLKNRFLQPLTWTKKGFPENDNKKQWKQDNNKTTTKWKELVFEKRRCSSKKERGKNEERKRQKKEEMLRKMKEATRSFEKGLMRKSEKAKIGFEREEKKYKKKKKKEKRKKERTKERRVLWEQEGQHPLKLQEMALCWLSSKTNKKEG